MKVTLYGQKDIRSCNFNYFVFFFEFFFLLCTLFFYFWNK